MPYVQSNQFLVLENNCTVVVCKRDECRLVKLMRLIDNKLESTPILDGIEIDLL